MKATTRRTLSMLLVLVMALGLCSVSVLADAGTITVYQANSQTPVSGTFTTIDAAAAAAGEGGRIVLSAGDFEFNGRQTIAVNGITLEGNGIGSTTIKTSANFVNGSTTNRKALLTLAGNNITVNNLSIDGSAYGCSSSFVLDDTEDTEFNVVRVNSGTAAFNNVSITGSKRTLLSIGTRSSTADLEATGLYCEAEYKSLSMGSIYADVNVVDGTFTLNSGEVNGFICLDEETEAGELENNSTNHYTLRHGSLGIYSYLTSTTKHFVRSYVNNQSFIDKALYASDMNKTYNINAVQKMVADAKAYILAGDRTIAEGMLDVLSYAKTVYPLNTNLANMYTELYTALYPSGT